MIYKYMHTSIKDLHNKGFRIKYIMHVLFHSFPM